MGYLQHGDVLIKRIKSFDEKEMKELNTKVVQEGEMTGHAHRINGDGFRIYQDSKTNRKYLRVVSPVKITHEEHKEFDIPPGDYVIDTVKEFDHFNEEIRRVLD